MKALLMILAILTSAQSAFALPLTKEELLEGVRKSNALSKVIALAHEIEGATSYNLEALNPFELSDVHQKECTGYSRSGGVVAATFFRNGRAVATILFGTPESIEDLKVCGELKVIRFGE